MAVSKERMIQISNTIQSAQWIDDHTGSEIEVAAVAVLSIGEQNHIIPILKDALFCVNGASKDSNGIWHLTSWSLSGNMDTRGVTVEQAIKEFNDGYRKAGGDFSGVMHQLTLVKAF